MGGPDRGRHALILVLTRRCDLRCTYCPTVKSGLPDLTPADVRRALEMFVSLYGGGDAKLFGGEPLLVPELVHAAFDAAPASVRLWLSTNATHLDEAILDRVRGRPGTILTVSLDGPSEVHDGQRRGRGSSYDAVLRWLPALRATPGFVVTQTIAPPMASRAAESFRHLRSLGVSRFNLLPGYYVRWAAEELEALRRSLEEIGEEIEAAWASGARLYLRNLFVRAPLPFFNTGLVVDVDRRIHPTNLILARPFDDLRERHAVGTLDDPPTREALELAASQAGIELDRVLAPEVIGATHRVDALLTQLCRRLYRPYLAARKLRAEAA